MLANFWLKKPSTYVGIATWGASGFMAAPTIASGVYHLFVIPLLIASVIWMAHHEGKGS